MVGNTTNSMIKAGGAGCIVLIPGCFINIILTIVGFVAPASILTSVSTLQVWYAIASSLGGVIVGIGVLLISLGTYGLWKLYNNVFPFVAGIIGFVVTAFWYLATPVSAANLTIGMIITAIAFILTGVFFLLLGIAFIILRKKTGFSELLLATAILSIILGVVSLVGGALVFAGIAHVAVIGLIMLVPTAICGALVFFRLVS